MLTIAELSFSETAVRKGIDNEPNAEQVGHLADLAFALDRVESTLGHPIRVSSGYRSPALNAFIGGSPRSAHMDGYAADFVCPGFGAPLDVCKALAGSGIPFDQIIQEGTWVHFSIAPAMRGELLTAHFAGGKASYAAGLT